MPRISYTHCLEHTDQTVAAFVKTHRLARTCATTDLVGSSEEKDGSLEEGQVSTDGALSLSLCLSPSLSIFLCHRWTQSHLFLSHMPYSYIISVSVCERLTCLLWHKRLNQPLHVHIFRAGLGYSRAHVATTVWRYGTFIYPSVDLSQSTSE